MLSTHCKLLGVRSPKEGSLAMLSRLPLQSPTAFHHQGCAPSPVGGARFYSDTPHP